MFKFLARIRAEYYQTNFGARLRFQWQSGIIQWYKLGEEAKLQICDFEETEELEKKYYESNKAAQK